MAIKRPIIVTALFNIGRDTWDSFGVSYDTYIDWMERLLAFDSYLVIYTDTELAPKIINKRKKYDPDFVKTKVRIKTLTELPTYISFYEKLSELMSSKNFIEQIVFKVPEMTRPIYNIIMFNKVFFILDSIANNYFEADYYIWLDAACFRNNIETYSTTWPDLNKLNAIDNTKVTLFSHNSSFDLNIPESKYILSQIRNIQGGCLFVPLYCALDFANSVYSTVKQCIEKGYIGSDEKIFDLVYLKNKEAFNLIKCNWREYYNIFKHDSI